MSYELQIGNRTVIAWNVNNAPQNSLCGFAVAHKFSLNPANIPPTITVNNFWLALWVSHASDKPMQALANGVGPQLAPFGPIPDLTLEQRGGNKLVFQNLSYAASVDIDSANHVMQLHLFGLAGGGRPTARLDDANWNFNPRQGVPPNANQALNGMPLWARTCAYDNQKCYATWTARERAANGGTRKFAVAMPLHANSLFKLLVSRDGQGFFDIGISANGDPTGANPRASRWDDGFGPGSIGGGGSPGGVGVITDGVFSALTAHEIMDPAFENALAAEDAAIALFRRIAQRGSPETQSLANLANTKIDTVAPPSATLPQEVFYVHT